MQRKSLKLGCMCYFSMEAEVDAVASPKQSLDLHNFSRILKMLFYHCYIQGGNRSVYVRHTFWILGARDSGR